jgi:hypothetical protein
LWPQDYLEPTFQLILNNLSSLFLATNHKDDRQRAACAEAFGSCAARHLNLVLDKLENLLVKTFLLTLMVH